MHKFLQIDRIKWKKIDFIYESFFCTSEEKSCCQVSNKKETESSGELRQEPNEL